MTQFRQVEDVNLEEHKCIYDGIATRRRDSAITRTNDMQYLWLLKMLSRDLGRQRDVDSSDEWCPRESYFN